MASLLLALGSPALGVILIRTVVSETRRWGSDGRQQRSALIFFLFLLLTPRGWDDFELSSISSDQKGITRG